MVLYIVTTELERVKTDHEHDTGILFSEILER
jgi:hypothetical protein